MRKQKNRAHTIQAGNTLSGIAKQYYNRPSLWPNIYRKNEETLGNPDQLALRQELLIPKLNGEPFELTQADSSCIAHGYYLVYNAYKKDKIKQAKAYLIRAKEFLK